LYTQQEYDGKKNVEALLFYLFYIA
jgi:hypothetical protein